MTSRDRLTHDQLARYGTCAPQLRKFAEVFPDGFDMEPATFAMIAADFDWPWAARRLLRGQAKAHWLIDVREAKKLQRKQIAEARSLIGTNPEGYRARLNVIAEQYRATIAYSFGENFIWQRRSPF